MGRGLETHPARDGFGQPVPTCHTLPVAKPLNRPFRRLRELERRARDAGPPAPVAVADERPFSEVASRDGVERARAAPGRVPPPLEPPRISAPREPEREHLFTLRVDGEQVEARRDDTDEVVLPWLARQEPRATLDLHGMAAELARRTLHRFLRARRGRGDSVVSIVTGRGRRSKAGPVLQTAAPDWLTEPAMATVVRAFISAPSARGGALLVLLEPRR